MRVDKRMYREKSGKFPRDIAISKKPLGFCVAHMLQDQGFFSWHLSRTLATIVDFFRIFNDFFICKLKRCSTRRNLDSFCILMSAENSG